jgi:hypothetical protein
LGRWRRRRRRARGWRKLPAYDTWGNLTRASETFGSSVTWTNPSRSDGRDDVCYDASDALYWMSVRAYDPTLGQ